MNLEEKNKEMIKQMKCVVCNYNYGYVAVIILEENNKHLGPDFVVPGGYILWLNGASAAKC